MEANIEPNYGPTPIVARANAEMCNNFMDLERRLWHLGIRLDSGQETAQAEEVKHFVTMQSGETVTIADLANSPEKYIGHTMSDGQKIVGLLPGLGYRDMVLLYDGDNGTIRQALGTIDVNGVPMGFSVATGTEDRNNQSQLEGIATRQEPQIIKASAFSAETPEDLLNIMKNTPKDTSIAAALVVNDAFSVNPRDLQLLAEAILMAHGRVGAVYIPNGSLVMELFASAESNRALSQSLRENLKVVYPIIDGSNEEVQEQYNEINETSRSNGKAFFLLSQDEAVDPIELNDKLNKATRSAAQSMANDWQSTLDAQAKH